MEPNNSLLQLTIMNKISKDTALLSRKINIALSSEENTAQTCILNSKKVDNEISVESIGSTLSDEAIAEICKANEIPTQETPISVVRFSTTYKDFSPSDIAKIKQTIYDLHNPSSIPPVTEPVDPKDPEFPNTDKQSFISEFYDTESLFEYLNKLNPAITKETGITRSQLIALTQNDDWEDSHYDFFGSLNRIFNQLDVDDDSILTFDEIEAFIGEELGANFTNYKNKVNQYTDQLQSYYESLSDQEKLEFALEKTREYLAAAGLEKHLEALNRLLEMEDLYNEIHVGNISITDLNVGNTSGYITLGSYMYYSYSSTGIISTDSDYNEDGADLGITLDISLLQGKWYELVNTLVHELTHATGALYCPADGTHNVYYSSISSLYEAGAITEAEKSWYENNWSSGIDLSNSNWKKFFQALECIWGEYAAYQADADYWDSIGEDVYWQDRHGTTAVDGKDEKDSIIDHVDASYNDDGYTEPYPDYKWWSYG